MSVKREELLKRYNSTKETLDILKEKDDLFLYATKDKYLPQVGYVCEIESINDLLKAQSLINDKKDSDLSDAIKSLGLNENEIPKNEDVKLLGLNIAYWDKDLKTRLEELRIELRIKALKKDLTILKKHLSENDNFDLDMSELSNEQV